MTRLEQLQRERADLARIAMEARTRRQGTQAITKLMIQKTVAELKLSLRKGKRT